MRPRRSGSANVSWPSPPYVVPMRLKRVSFSEIGSKPPSQNIQPAGAKFPAKRRISPTYGWAIARSSVLAREDACQGNAEVDRQEGLHVQVRLAATDVRDRAGYERDEVRGRTVELVAAALRKDVARRRRAVGVGGRGVQDVLMRRHLCDRQRVSLFACSLAKRVAAAGMNRNAAP